MGVAVPRAPLGGRGPGTPPPPKSRVTGRVTGPSLLVDCYLKIKFKIKKYPLSPPPPPLRGEGYCNVTPLHESKRQLFREYSLVITDQGSMRSND